VKVSAKATKSAELPAPAPRGKAAALVPPAYGASFVDLAASHGVPVAPIAWAASGADEPPAGLPVPARSFAAVPAFATPPPDDATVLRRRALGSREQLGAIPPVVSDVLRSTGQPLDAVTRGFMELRFGRSLAHVRLHTGATAAAATRAVNAEAYTVGTHIVFGDNAYAPGTQEGRHLIAHEVAHTLEGNGTAPTTSLLIGDPADPAEHHAEAAAHRIARGLPAPVRPVAAVGPVLRRQPGDDDAPGWTPVGISGTTFEEAAATFAYQLNRHAEQLRKEMEMEPAQIAIVVINAGIVRLFNSTGASASRMMYHLKRPIDLPTGVTATKTTKSRKLHGLLSNPDGAWTLTRNEVKGDADFAHDIVEQQDFNETIGKFGYAFYVVPHVDLDPRQTPAEVAKDVDRPIPEVQPDLLKFEAKGQADLAAWPAGVVPLTPQQTSVGSMGTFVCRVNKYDPWQNLLANVADNLQPMNFRWEVLRLDDKLTVTGKSVATRAQGVAGQFAQRQRHLEEDRKVRLGEHPERQSIPEQVMRQAIDDQYGNARALLAYSGEVVLTLIHALAGDTQMPSLEDYIDIPFNQPGNYFVRCLATPVVGPEAKHRRATSVAGVTISVFKIDEFAAASLSTFEEEKQTETGRVAQNTATLAELEQAKAAGNPDYNKYPVIDTQIAVAKLRVTLHERLAKGAGDEAAVLAAKVDYVRAMIALLTGPPAPQIDARVLDKSKVREGLAAEIGDNRKQEAEYAGQIARITGRLGDATRSATFKGMLVDDTTGARKELLFSVGERPYIARDALEVRIADITSEKGRVFTGTGDGALGDGRSDAWHLAMRDLRRNLGRGRGYLSWRAPQPYASLSEGIDNPMQLQVGELDQIKETVDDAAHAATLVALLAAPFTGGASLGVLAVLAPIQAASSLYNVINRAMYGDLEPDRESIMDFINIATFGLGKLSTVGKGVSIVASSSRFAVRLLDRGMYIVIAYGTYQDLMKEVPGEDPREAKRRKLRALLSMLEAAAIPIAHSMFPEAGLAPKPLPEGRPGEAPQGRPGARAAEPGNEPAPRREEAPPPERREPGQEPRADEGPAKPATAPRAGAVAVPHDLLAVLPADVQKNAPPQINTALTADTVRIVYSVHPETRVITEMRMEIGPGTRPEYVKGHVETARVMARYMGLTGRIRIVMEQLTGYITRNYARPGSRAWEARLELGKLNGLILDRAALYQDATPLGREQLRMEIDSLQAQFEAHARDADLFEVEGTGEVAAKGPTAGETERLRRGYPEAKDGYYWYYMPPRELEYRATRGKEPLRYNKDTGEFDPPPKGAKPNESFAPDITQQEVLQHLGAYEYSVDPTTGERTPTSEFRKVIELLMKEGLIDKPEDLFDPAKRGKEGKTVKAGGLTERTVRHNLKDPFIDMLLDRATDATRLRELQVYKDVLAATKDPAQALRAASHSEFLRYSNALPSADRGSFGEQWYKRQYAPKADTQVSITKEEAAKQGVTLGADSRFIDQAEGNTIREIKNVTERLNRDIQEQIKDNAKLLTKTLMVGKTPNARPVQIHEVVTVFPDPQGAISNRTWLEQFLREYGEGRKVYVEVHDSTGQKVQVSFETRAWLTNGGLQKWATGAGPGPSGK
jgi:hypothetical protein